MRLFVGFLIAELALTKLGLVRVFLGHGSNFHHNMVFTQHVHRGPTHTEVVVKMYERVVLLLVTAGNVCVDDSECKFPGHWDDWVAI